MNWQHVAAVFFGGGAGAVCRYLAASTVGGWLGPGYPWGTLAVNLAGCLAMGILVGLFALAWTPGQGVRTFLTVGFLGGFTTFSAMTADVLLLSERGEGLAAVSYALASLLGCVFLAWAGMRLVRLVFS